MSPHGWKLKTRWAGMKRGKSQLEETLALHLRADNIPFVREHRFHPVRRWRFDFALPDYRIGIECEGLTHPGTKSRHTTNSGFEADCDKYNEAAIAHWRVLRFTWNMIRSGTALAMIQRAIKES